MNDLFPPHDLVLQSVNESTCRVLDAQGMCLGHFKRIQGVWKFKALGRDDQGQLVPGGGPLTHRHNAVVNGLSPANVNAVLRG